MRLWRGERTEKWLGWHEAFMIKDINNNPCRFFLVQLLSSHVASGLVKTLADNKALSSALDAADIALLSRKISSSSSKGNDMDEGASVASLAATASRLSDWPLDNDVAVVASKSSSSPSRDLAAGSLEHRLIMSRNPGEILRLLKSMKGSALSKTPFAKLHQAWDTLQLAQEIYSCLAGGSGSSFLLLFFSSFTFLFSSIFFFLVFFLVFLFFFLLGSGPEGDDVL